MTMNVEGGAALPIHITTNKPIGAPALPVYLYTNATLGNRRVETGITSVYSVSDAELADGTFKLEGRTAAIPAIDYTSADTSIPDARPIPVYILNPATPTPPVVIPWYLAGGVSAANCIAAYQAKGAASYAASKINLINPGTYNLIDGVSPTWDAINGWTFDGITTYLRTENLYQAITTNNCSIVIGYSNLNNTVNSRLFGCYYENYDPPYQYSSFNLSNKITPSYRVYNTEILETVVNGSLPVTSIVSFCSDNTQYLNGVVDSGIVYSTGDNTNTYAMIELYLGCFHYKDTTPDEGAYQLANYKLQAIAFYNAILTPSQVSAITTAIQAL